MSYYFPKKTASIFHHKVPNFAHKETQSQKIMNESMQSNNWRISYIVSIGIDQMQKRWKKVIKKKLFYWYWLKLNNNKTIDSPLQSIRDFCRGARSYFWRRIKGHRLKHNRYEPSTMISVEHNTKMNTSPPWLRSVMAGAAIVKIGDDWRHHHDHLHHNLYSLSFFSITITQRLLFLFIC